MKSVSSPAVSRSMAFVSAGIVILLLAPAGRAVIRQGSRLEPRQRAESISTVRGIPIETAALDIAVPLRAEAMPTVAADRPRGASSTDSEIAKSADGMIIQRLLYTEAGFDPWIRYATEDRIVIETARNVLSIDVVSGSKIDCFASYGASFIAKSDKTYVFRGDSSLIAFDALNGLMAWRRELDGSVLPASARALICDATAGGILPVAGGSELFAVSLQDGSDAWHRFTELGAVERIAAAGRYVVCADEARIIAIDAENGNIRWTHTSERKVLTLEAAKRFVWYRNQAGHLRILRAACGTEVWSDRERYVRVVSHADTFLLARNASARHLFLELREGETGASLWTTTIAAGEEWEIVELQDKFVVCVSEPDVTGLDDAMDPDLRLSTLVIVAIKDGSILGNHRLPVAVNSVAGSERSLYAAAPSNWIYALEISEIDSPESEPAHAGANISISLAPRAASLRIDGTPKGAQIYIDGDKVGPLPLTVRELDSGIHRVKISSPGYSAVEQTIALEAGQRARERFDLPILAAQGWTTPAMSSPIQEIIPGATHLIVSDASSIAALKVDTGTIAWRISSEVNAGPIAAEGLAVWSADYSVFCAEISTGEIQWTCKGNPMWIDISGHVILAADALGTLLGISLRDGTIQWHQKGKPWQWLELAGETFAGLRSGERLVALNAATGRRIWIVKVAAGLRFLGVEGEAIFCVDPRRSELLRIDLTTGHVQNIEHGVTGTPALGERYIIYERKWVIESREVTWLRGARISQVDLDPFCVDPDLPPHDNRTLATYGDYAFLIVPGEITALSLPKAEVGWVRPYRGETTPLCVSGGILCIAAGNSVLGVSVETGSTLWAIETSGLARNVLVRADENAVYLVDGIVVHKTNIR